MYTILALILTPTFLYKYSYFILLLYHGQIWEMIIIIDLLCITISHLDTVVGAPVVAVLIGVSGGRKPQQTFMYL